VDPTTLERLRSLHPDALFMSAQTGQGVDAVLDAIVAALKASTVDLELVIPYDRGEVLADAHETGTVLDQRHDDTATVITVRLPHEAAARFRGFVAPEPGPIEA